MSKRYLIIKIAAIGDVIMALPMIEKIREIDCDAEITWICGKTVKPILEYFPIDHILSINEKKLLAGSKIEKIKTVFEVWRKIAGKKYNVVALGHAARQYQILTLLTRKDFFYSFSHIMGEVCPIPGRHHSDEYVHLINRDNKEPVQVATFPKIILPPNIKERLQTEKKIVLLAPGGAKNLLADDFLRRWPIDYYVKLAAILKSHGYDVIIAGAKSDLWVKEYFTGIDVINLIGKTNLIEMIGVFQNINYVITHDSGPLHLAGLTNVRLIGIFGPTNPLEKMPVRQDSFFVWINNKLACCPCYDGKYYANCKDNICMKMITPDDIYNIIADW